MLLPSIRDVIMVFTAATQNMFANNHSLT